MGSPGETVKDPPALRVEWVGYLRRRLARRSRLGPPRPLPGRPDGLASSYEGRGRLPGVWRGRSQDRAPGASARRAGCLGSTFLVHPLRSGAYMARLPRGAPKPPPLLRLSPASGMALRKEPTQVQSLRKGVVLAEVPTLGDGPHVAALPELRQANQAPAGDLQCACRPQGGAALRGGCLSTLSR